MRMICSVYACVIMRVCSIVKKVECCQRLCAFTAQTSDCRTLHTDAREPFRMANSASQPLGQVCLSDLKHVYTQCTQRAASNGSLSRDAAAEPASEACVIEAHAKGAMSGRHGHGRARGRLGMPAGGGPI